MKFSFAVLSLATVAAVTLATDEASAAGRREARAANRQPYPYNGPPQTILPSRAELAAVPVPRQGAVAAYPLDVVRYGLTIHPGSRVVRGMIIGR